MKRNSLFFFLLSLFMVVIVKAQNPTDPNWQIFFADEFNGPTLDSVWIISNGVHEAGTDTEGFTYDTAANVDLIFGKLRLALRRDTISHTPCHYHTPHYYSSGTILSADYYLYGYFEIYAKIPTSPGYWSSFWLWNSGYDWYNEIDVIEVLGNDANFVESNVHWNPNNVGIGNVQRHYCPYSTGYHWYGVEWDSRYIIWYVDHHEVRRDINLFTGGYSINHPMQIILSIALCNNDHPNHVTSSTIIPNYMFIDKAYVYKLQCDSNTTVVEIPDFSTYQYGVKKSIRLSGATQLPIGETTNLHATDFIELTNGFEVPLGTGFFADVNICQ